MTCTEDKYKFTCKDDGINNVVKTGEEKNVKLF